MAREGYKKPAAKPPAATKRRGSVPEGNNNLGLGHKQWGKVRAAAGNTAKASHKSVMPPSPLKRTIRSGPPPAGATMARIGDDPGPGT